MAIAFNNSATINNQASGNTLTLSYSLGVGSDLLVVGFSGPIGTTDVVTGVTYGSASMTRALGRSAGAATGPISSGPISSGPITGPGRGNYWAYVYFLVNPPSGTNNLVISVSSNPSGFGDGGVSDYTGAATSGQPDATGEADSGSFNNQNQTVSLTTQADSCWVFGYAANGGSSGSWTGGAGATLRRGSSDGHGAIFDSNGPVHPAGSYSMTMVSPDGLNTTIGLVVSFSPALLSLLPYIETWS